jgi:hypothetical protein
VALIGCRAERLLDRAAQVDAFLVGHQ